MTRSLSSPTNVRTLFPETLGIESEQFEQAKDTSSQWKDESEQWQAYLNALAALPFQDWLEEKLSIKAQKVSFAGTEAIYLSINNFKLCLLVQEHVLDEAIRLPQHLVEQPENAAHGYVALEVLEEQEEVIVRGFLRYDELISITDQKRITLSKAYLMPLSSFDEEINHLLAYLRYSHPEAISLPAASTQLSAQALGQSSAQTTAASSPTVSSPIEAASSVRNRLGRWLDGTLAEGWQTLDRLINPGANLAWSTREADKRIAKRVSGGKLLNLGMQLGSRPVVLLVTVIPEEEEKIGINVQILPTGDDAVLPPQLTVRLISRAGKVLQSVTSREQDNYIQMRPFKGRSGVQFGVEVELNDTVVSEAFEL